MEKMRRDEKRRRREDRRLHHFRRKNKCFPSQYGSDDETPESEETLEFWRSINNREASDEWRGDELIKEVLNEMREKLQRRWRWR